MIAVVRIRGNAKVKGDIERTMELMHLKTVNNCVVVPENEKYLGMVHKVKDHVTYGTVTKETFKKMLVKWGRFGKKRLQLKDVDKTVDEIFEGKKRFRDLNINPVFKLHPPRRGYEGIKIAYSQGGALGNRKEKINELLERMI
jgi:large subunit ribosomal protein L30